MHTVDVLGERTAGPGGVAVGGIGVGVGEVETLRGEERRTWREDLRTLKERYEADVERLDVDEAVDAIVFVKPCTSSFLSGSSPFSPICVFSRPSHPLETLK